MTRTNIIRMAREACSGLPTGDEGLIAYVFSDLQLERFAALVAAAERDACAKVCSALTEKAEETTWADVSAAAIRARSQA